MKLTPWFSGTDIPFRPGAYERDYRPFGGETWYSEWTGTTWLSPARTPLVASKQVTAAFTQGGIRWRGLAKDPKS